MTREEQLRFNADMIVLDYCLNNEQATMTEGELLEHVYKTVFDIKCNEYEQLQQGKGICAGLKFLGKEKMDAIILEVGRKHELLKA